MTKFFVVLLFLGLFSSSAYSVTIERHTTDNRGLIVVQYPQLSGVVDLNLQKMASRFFYAQTCGLDDSQWAKDYFENGSDWTPYQPTHDVGLTPSSAVSESFVFFQKIDYTVSVLSSDFLSMDAVSFTVLYHAAHPDTRRRGYVIGRVSANVLALDDVLKTDAASQKKLGRLILEKVESQVSLNRTERRVLAKKIRNRLQGRYVNAKGTYSDDERYSFLMTPQGLTIFNLFDVHVLSLIEISLKNEELCPYWRAVRKPF
jgi:hypothetical protein